MGGVLIVGEAPTMRNSSPSKLAKVLTMDGVFFRSLDNRAAAKHFEVKASVVEIIRWFSPSYSPFP
jgi:hypothetical protein